ARRRLPRFPTRRSSDLSLGVLRHAATVEVEQPQLERREAVAVARRELVPARSRRDIRRHPEAIGVNLGNERLRRRVGLLGPWQRSEEHTSELQSRENLV